MNKALYPTITYNADSVNGIKNIPTNIVPKIIGEYANAIYGIQKSIAPRQLISTNGSVITTNNIVGDNTTTPRRADI
jgi:hypothetical protein